jgi:hypothetical protein
LIRTVDSPPGSVNAAKLAVGGKPDMPQTRQFEPRSN